MHSSSPRMTGRPSGDTRFARRFGERVSGPESNLSLGSMIFVQRSPVGSRIVALSPDTSHGRIIVVDVVTGDALLLAEGREAIWLDDHTLLVEV